VGALGTSGRSRLQRSGQNRFGDGQRRGSLWPGSRTGIGGHGGGRRGWRNVVCLNEVGGLAMLESLLEAGSGHSIVASDWPQPSGD
jgi:hypothetical protein